MLRSAFVRSLRASAPRAIRTTPASIRISSSPVVRPSQFQPFIASQTIRFYSAPAGLSKDEVEGRIVNLLKNFDKVCLWDPLSCVAQKKKKKKKKSQYIKRKLKEIKKIRKYMLIQIIIYRSLILLRLVRPRYVMSKLQYIHIWHTCVYVMFYFLEKDHWGTYTGTDQWQLSLHKWPWVGQFGYRWGCDGYWRGMRCLYW